MVDKKIPKNVRTAILTLGKYCRERACVDCAFSKNPHGCVFEQEHNPCWMVEDTLGEEGLTELYPNLRENNDGT